MARIEASWRQTAKFITSQVSSTMTGLFRDTVDEQHRCTHDSADVRREMDIYADTYSSRVESANRETSENFDRDSEADRLEWEQKVHLFSHSRLCLPKGASVCF